MTAKMTMRHFGCQNSADFCEIWPEHSLDVVKQKCFLNRDFYIQESDLDILKTIIINQHFYFRHFCRDLKKSRNKNRKTVSHRSQILHGLLARV